jgi:hypothetical protein
MSIKYDFIDMFVLALEKIIHQPPENQTLRVESHPKGHCLPPILYCFAILNRLEVLQKESH